MLYLKENGEIIAMAQEVPRVGGFSLKMVDDPLNEWLTFDTLNEALSYVSEKLGNPNLYVEV